MIDLKKFRKVGHTKTHTILEHDDGHVLHVAHEKLEHKHKKELKNLHLAKGGKVPPPPVEDGPEYEKFKKGGNFADGGKVTGNPHYFEGASAPTEEVDTTYPETFPPDPSDPFQRSATAALQEIESSPPNPDLLSKSEPALQPANKSTQTQDIFGKAAQSQSDVDVLKNEQDIQQKLGENESKHQQANQKIAQDKVKLDHSLEQQSQQIMQDEVKELQAARDDMNNGHFHPKDIYSGNDTWGKVRTGIGLILGGLGASANGGRNPVLDMLQKQIDRDAEAGGNLYKALEKKYGSKREALNMTKIYQTGALLDQLEVEAAKAASPAAKLNAQAAVQQLQMTLNGKMQEHARNQAVNQMLSGNESNSEKAGLLITQVVPENRQPEVRKELKEAQDMGKIQNNLLKSFDEVSNMAFAGAFSPHQRDAIIEPIVAQLSKESAGRYTEQDARAIKHLFPSALDAPGTAKLKRQKLQEFVSQKMNFPSLQEFGIPVAGPETTAPPQISFKPKK